MMNFTVLEDTSLTGQLPGEQSNLTFFPVGETQTRDGVVNIQSDGSFTYQPDQNYNGDDQFFFASVDADGRLVGFGAIDIVIEAVNDTPVADPVTIVTDEDVSITGLLTAFDEEGADLTFALVEDDEDHLGVLMIDPDGRFTYTPDQDVNGSDSFQFQVNDGETVGVATFDAVVNPINDAPRFRRDLLSRELLEDTSITYQLIADDPDMDDVEYFLDPDVRIFGGDASITPEGILTYTPKPNVNSFEDIGVIARDEQGATTKARVTLNITPVDDPPTAEDLSFEVMQGGDFFGRIKANDVDTLGRLSFRVADDMPPSAGIVTFFPDFGLFNYVANDDAPMTDSFSVRVSGDGGFVFASVDVVILEPAGATDQDDRLVGTEIAEVIMGMDGADTIFGLDGDDQLEGGRGADVINGGRDDDTIEGGAGRDTLTGEAGADLIKGGAGRDQVMGGRGRDVIEGSGGRDILEGGGGRDEIDGGAGFDTITGGRGADTLTGSGGGDRFVFGLNFGRDTITDFEQGRDKIAIETENGLLDFDLLRIVQVGDDVQIRTDGGRVTVLDDEVANFQAADFIF